MWYGSFRKYKHGMHWGSLDTSDAKNSILAFLGPKYSITVCLFKMPFTFLLHKYKLNLELLSALGMEKHVLRIKEESVKNPHK